VFGHENFLDIKDLVKERQFLEKYECSESESPLIRARRRLLSNQTTDIENNCYQYYKKNAEDLTLSFESRFESGNLFLAQKVSDQEYNCLM
jgi:hypothetical protein